MKKIISKLIDLFRLLCNKFYFTPKRKYLLIILDICLVIGIIQISTGYEQILLMQEQEMIYEQEPTNINYYYEKIDFDNITGDMAIKNLFKCYQENNDLDNVYLKKGTFIHGLGGSPDSYNNFKIFLFIIIKRRMI